MNKCMAHRPHAHAIADIIDQAQNSFHCLYTVPSNAFQVTAENK